MLKRGNEALLDAMLDATTRFCEETEGIYRSLSREAEKSRVFASDFKEEGRIFAKSMAAVKEKHRNLIRVSQRTIQDALASGSLALQNELQDALCKPISQGFLRMVESYSGAGLKPEKSELEALTVLAESHPSALRMIDKLCESTGAEYRVVHPSIQALESDISFLARYGTLFDLPITSKEQLEPGLALFGGSGSKGFTIEPVTDEKNPATGKGVGDRLIPSDSEAGVKMRVLRGDKIIGEGERWSAPYLSAAAEDFAELKTRLTEMKGRWCGGIYPIEPAGSDEAIAIARKMGAEVREMAAARVPETLKN